MWAAFHSRKTAMKFARYYLYRQHLYQKALTMASLLSQYKLALYFATNCDEPLLDSNYLPQDRACFWFDEPPEVMRGCFTDEVDANLPLHLQETIYFNNAEKRQYDFAVFTGQGGICYCIDAITDIWPIDKNTFCIESKDGHTYGVQGLEDDEARRAARIEFGIEL